MTALAKVALVVDNTRTQQERSKRNTPSVVMSIRRWRFRIEPHELTALSLS